MLYAVNGLASIQSLHRSILDSRTGLFIVSQPVFGLYSFICRSLLNLFKINFPTEINQEQLHVSPETQRLWALYAFHVFTLTRKKS